MQTELYHIAQAYFRGTISHEDEVRLNDFIQSSEENAQLFRQWSEEWQQQAHAQASLRTQQAWATMQARMSTSSRPKAKPYAWWGAAAVALLLLTTGLWWLLPTTQIELFLAQTAAHEQRTITLPDGTDVILNSHSRLAYAEDFNRRTRHITFEGEAFFNVAKDANKPFVIEVGEYSVTVLGTQFNLSAYLTDNQYTLTLKEGAVKIKYRHDSILVQPNEQVRLDLHSATFTTQLCKAETSEAWMHNRLEAENILLLDLAQRLERQYDVDIIFADKQAQEEIVYISISTDEPFEAVCGALEALLPITIEQENEQYIIHTR